MKINFKRLNHVQVCIPPDAEDRARDFYGRLLGLKEIEKPAVLRDRGGLWYEVADIQLHIGAEEPGPRSTKRHPAFEVKEIGAVRAYLEGHGVQTRDEEEANGFLRFSFFDPFGNRFELMEQNGRG